jgi:hypothetical protein
MNEPGFEASMASQDQSPWRVDGYETKGRCGMLWLELGQIGYAVMAVVAVGFGLAVVANPDRDDHD